MKQIILFFLILFSNGLYAQTANNKVCCDENKTEATGMFAKFSDEKEFRDKHPDPLKINYDENKGEMIKFLTSDGKDGNGYFIKGTSDKWLLVFHEWWGLNDYIKKESDKFSEIFPGVNILAVDLYDGAVASTREEAQKLVQGLNKERAITIINGAFNYGGSESKFGTIGWCLGGTWSCQAAIEGGDKVDACVIFYGAPEENTDRLKLLDAPVLMIHPLKDKWINQDMMDKFSVNMKSLDKKFEILTYDADHGFANPSSPNFNNKEANESWLKVKEFLEKNLVN